MADEPVTPRGDMAANALMGSNAPLPTQDPKQSPEILTSNSGGVQGGNLRCCFKIVMLYRMVRPGSPAQALLPCNISLQQAHATGCFHALNLAMQIAAAHAHAAAVPSCTLTRGAHRRPTHLLPAGDS